MPLQVLRTIIRKCASAEPVKDHAQAVREAAAAPRDVLSAHLDRALENQQRAKEARNRQAAREAAAEAADSAEAGQSNATPQQQHLQRHQPPPAHSHGESATPHGAERDGPCTSQRPWAADAPGVASSKVEFRASEGNGHSGERCGAPQGGARYDESSDRQFDRNSFGACSRDAGRNSGGDYNSSSSSCNRYHVQAGDYDAWAGPVAVTTVQCSDWESRSFPWDAEVQKINRNVFRNFTFRPMQVLRLYVEQCLHSTSLANCIC